MNILLCNFLSAFLGTAIVFIPGYLLVCHWEKQANEERKKQEEQRLEFDDSEKFYDQPEKFYSHN